MSLFCRCYEGMAPCEPCRDADARGLAAPVSPWECKSCKHAHVGSCESARRIRDGTVLCLECGRTCRCEIYVGPVPHSHLPGGDDRYPLCVDCEKRWFERHRRGNLKIVWLAHCAEGCLYDHVQATVPIGHGIGYRAESA